MAKIFWSILFLTFVLPLKTVDAQERPFVIAIHGGSGTIARNSMTPEREREYRATLSQSLTAGRAVLSRGGSSLDAVVAAITVMEDSPLFNAGKGAVFTSEGKNELDASIMDGATTKAGAVAGVRRVKNPILAARAVMEKSRHVLFAGEGADAFAQAQGLETVPESYFHTDFRWQQLQRAKERDRIQLDHTPTPQPTTPQPPTTGGVPERRSMLVEDMNYGTVGAVAIDARGNLAAATSTGGLTNKLPGRIGDSPLIGAGTYAENGVVAVSATGSGEMFIRTLASYDIAARMRHAGEPAQNAAEATLERIRKIEGRGGVVFVDGAGEPGFAFTTEGMYRGYAKGAAEPVVKIYKDE
jgi:L-asparaginase / beta-aspartyl-peptidase